MNEIIKLIEKLEKNHSLEIFEYEKLLNSYSEETASLLALKAQKARKEIYSNKVFIRGLIEVSNFCKNDCLYCGIRKSNKNVSRYRLSLHQILDCCVEGYSLGFRTFVLQGGEDMYFTDERLCELILKIKTLFPDCAVTLSLGERSKESYQKLYDAGADRYLLRHETADSFHYSRLHPPQLTLENRIRCLENLKEIGFQVGCGFMVGSPYQTTKELAKDLKFIEEFKPDMCGIGPFVPHHETPFATMDRGSSELTCYLLSIVRLIHPAVLLPSTTALGTIDKSGREKGILSGANVVMPNLSPLNVRAKYELYDNKLSTGDEAAQSVKSLSEKMEAIGYEIVCDRGDIKKNTNLFI